jgi:hypothetical protein
VNPDPPETKDVLSVWTDSENEWNYDSREWEYTAGHTAWDYDYPRGPVCKVVWVKDSKQYEKEFSSREDAVQKQKSLLLKEIPAIIKPC